MKSLQKITPCLWFENQAEEAAKLYTSLFENSKVLSVNRNGEGNVMIVNFQLEGQEFIALNGGPQFKFNEAISFLVDCETQEEVDDMWGKLTEGGEEGPCGWLKDKYGVSWQVVPTILNKLMSDPDPEKSQRVHQALRKMKKIEIAGLQKAYEGQ